MTQVFTVIAYRWGWLNGHWYHVYAGPDETKAMALAQNEVQDRGGKYGCAIIKFSEDGTDYDRVGYFPSMHGEEKPAHNYRIDMFESLGHRMHDFAQGRAYLPDGSGLLKPHTVQPPQWVIDAVHEAENREQIMSGALNNLQAEAGSLSPSPSTKEATDENRDIDPADQVRQATLPPAR